MPYKPTLYVHIVDGCLSGVYCDRPIEVIQINQDDQSEEPTIITKEDVGEIKDLLEQDESPLLADTSIVAEYRNLRIYSTFHDYQIELVKRDAEDNVIETLAQHGMGDGVDQCEWNAGTLGLQLHYKHLLETPYTYNEMLEAYFPDRVEEFHW